MRHATTKTLLATLASVCMHCNSAETEEGLRTHVARVSIGMQVGGSEIFWNPGDQTLIPAIARQANYMLIGNNLKWAAPGVRALRPTKDSYDFSDADQLIELAQQHRLRIRAHTLVWGNALPPWLTERAWTRSELLTMLQSHIATVVGRYRGKIAIWDVVNEAIEWNGTYKDNFWLRNLGPEYIELAFRWAHEADPDALLFFNEDGTEGLSQGSDLFLEIVRNLRNQGVPIHGVGLETHIDLNYRTLGGNDTASPSALRDNITRLGMLGLQVHISEFDVRIPLPADAQSLSAQAEVYRSLFKVCEANRFCTGFFIWGLTDRWSWIPSAFPGLGAALPFDSNYTPKPAYFALLQGMRETSEKCFEWAQRRYPTTLRGAQPAASYYDYYYRYYSESGNYVGIMDGTVFYWDPAASSEPVAVMTLAACLESESQ